ncbi:hypothetical protein V1520DRAFT_29359 [Lipomyces starkeyi]|uniref:Secreted protein n=1 Tax=Lipomyces starkeyi NRRL Y-11557 TaxID=675824 RepID=A0A1E3PUN3_LIPST|nr:hypothetical protein LIPSTDRAFT_201014 [Lipomyces starkeyi NRRL Y-11557]
MISYMVICITIWLILLNTLHRPGVRPCRQHKRPNIRSGLHLDMFLLASRPATVLRMKGKAPRPLSFVGKERMIPWTSKLEP